MARVTGFRCDGASCGNVSEADALPIGWMTLSVSVDPKADAHPEGNVFHICSNKCLRNLGRDRYAAAVERGDEKRRTVTRKPKVGV